VRAGDAGGVLGCLGSPGRGFLVGGVVGGEQLALSRKGIEEEEERRLALCCVLFVR
jgi:hypothetical protein